MAADPPAEPTPGLQFAVSPQQLRTAGGIVYHLFRLSNDVNSVGQAIPPPTAGGLIGATAVAALTATAIDVASKLQFVLENAAVLSQLLDQAARTYEDLDQHNRTTLTPQHPNA